MFLIEWEISECRKQFCKGMFCQEWMENSTMLPMRKKRSGFMKMLQHHIFWTFEDSPATATWVLLTVGDGCVSESNTLSGDGHNNNEKVNQLKWAQEWMQAEPLWMHVRRCSLQTETQADFHMHCECNISVQAGVLKLAMNCTVQFVLMGQHQVFGRGANCHAEWSDWTTLCVLWKPWVTCHGLVLMLALAHAVLLWIVETLQEIGAQRSFKSPDCFELGFLVCCQAANSF